MSSPRDALQRERIDAVLALAAKRLQPAQRSQVEAFARGYFHRLDADDLLSSTPEDLLGALLAHWQFGATRQPGQTLVRVQSPTVADNGWASRHSVIDIVNDDMPFLVDTTTMEINRQGLTLHLIVHPIFAVERDAHGKLTALRPGSEAKGEAKGEPTARRESWMHIEIDRLVDAQQRADLVSGIERVLRDVRAAVEDWKPMVVQLRGAIVELQAAPAALPADIVKENLAFLQWLADDHMTLLGYRCHELVSDKGDDALRLVSGSGLGLLRESAEEKLSASFSALPANARAMAHAPLPLLVITKANTRSTVHRPGYTDYVGVKRYNAQGEVTGEHRFIGLFTSTAYSARVAETPLLRGKVEAIVTRAGLPPGGHLAKALHHILETYPRDDLFQMSDDDLYETALGILALGERQRLRLFVYRDPYDRFISCLVYAPREAYSTDLRIKFQRILVEAFSGTGAEFDVQLGNAILARIHFTVRTTPGQVPVVDRKALEAKLHAAARRWDDELRDALIDAEGEARGLELFKRWGAGFPLGYRERVSARAAVPDVLKIAGLSLESPLALALYRPLGAEPGALGFKVYLRGGAVVLSDSLPMLEHMGLRVLGEHNFRIGGGGSGSSVDDTIISLHDFELHAAAANDIEPEAQARLFEDTFARVFRGEVENDDFNRLVLRAGLSAEEIVVLRAYAKYLKQIGFALSQSAIEATVVAHPRIARMLVGLFKLRFDPAAHDEEGATAQVNGIEKALEKVSNLQEDRVLRQLLALIQATLRTNFWRTGVGHSGAAGPRRAFLSLKLDSAKVPGLPEPRPLYEISVYSPRFEGIHLRGGKVARGGLRWSDRAEDFRTEVLGLVKAQMVKNTVIVPVGSKGGFVLEEGTTGVGPRGLHEGRRGLLSGLPARAAGPDRQPCRRPTGAPAAGGAARRERPLPRGRGRQRHSNLLRLRQRGERRIRPLARRCVCLRRQRRLRPQGHGHHRAWRVGKRQASLPRTRHRHADERLHRGRRGRHVGRRVRQRHAVVQAHPPAGGLRPPPCFHRPHTRRRRVLHRTRAPVQTAALGMDGLRRAVDLGRRRRLGTLGKVDPHLAASARRVGHHRRKNGTGRPAQRHPRSPGRPALQRRHRHLHQGQQRDPRRRWRPCQRRAAHQRRGPSVQGA